MRVNLPSVVGSVKFRVRIRTVSIPASARAKHHIAALNRTFMHLSEMNGTEVDLQSPFITEGFQTYVALHPFLSRRRVRRQSRQDGGVPPPLHGVGGLSQMLDFLGGVHRIHVAGGDRGPSQIDGSVHIVGILALRAIHTVLVATSLRTRRRVGGRVVVGAGHVG